MPLHKQRLLLADAVDNSSIAVAFELKVRKLLVHPHVERIMQEEIG
jgi:hypothetical protein